MLRPKYFLITTLLLSFLSNLNAQFKGFQEIPDSLIIKSYQSLYSDYYKLIENSEYNRLYATAYLKKAYLDKDTLNIAYGYYMITYYTDDTNYIFNDSLLKYAKLLPKKEFNYFAWHAYQSKGGYFYDKRNFKKSFDNHIRAFNIAKESKNLEFQNISTTNLGLLKERTGKFEEALLDFKKSYKYDLKKIEKLDTIDAYTLDSFLNSTINLANSYRLNKKYDSAQYFNQSVFKYKNIKGTERYIGQSIVNSAEVHFELENYQATIDTVNTSLSFLIVNNDAPNIAIAYYLRAMSTIKLDLSPDLKDFERMDSIFNLNNDLHPSLRSGYTYLIDHYKKNGDLSKQLYYIEQLLKFDSLVYDYERHITDAIYFDKNSKLLHTQQKLKSKIKKDYLKNRAILLAICFLGLLLVFELLRRRKRNKKIIKEYQYKFDTLINSKTLPENVTENKNLKRKQKEFNLSASLVEEILSGLETFELRKGFLDKNISANRLAKDLNTNPNYLGQIIKYQFDKNFRQYINDLRIDFVLKAIRLDRKMLNYSIQAIANEAGYNNAEPFSKAFKAKTGYYPSDFISKIKSEKGHK
jgi:AraC-like DNA-binding protein